MWLNIFKRFASKILGNMLQVNFYLLMFIILKPEIKNNYVNYVIYVIFNVRGAVGNNLFSVIYFKIYIYIIEIGKTSNIQSP